MKKQPKLSFAWDGQAPSSTDEMNMLKLMTGIHALFAATMQGSEFVLSPKGLELLFAESFREKVSRCNRASVFITYREMGPCAEIRFCQSSELVKKVEIAFLHLKQEFLIMAQ